MINDDVNAPIFDIYKYMYNRDLVEPKSFIFGGKLLADGCGMEWAQDLDDTFSSYTYASIMILFLHLDCFQS